MSLKYRSIRKYIAKPLEPDQLELILKAGTRVANGGNLQLYSFIVVDDDEKKMELYQAWETRPA